MIKYFVDAWDLNKGKLEQYIKTHKQGDYANSYEDLLKKTIDIVINNHEGIEFNLNNVKTIDYGDYQGTLIIAFAESAYQPCENETFYTIVSYGSCSGCDTLEGIVSYDYNELPNNEQVKDYMLLCLHMVQHIKCFGNVEDNWKMNKF